MGKEANRACVTRQRPLWQLGLVPLEPSGKQCGIFISCFCEPNCPSGSPIPSSRAQTDCFKKSVLPRPHCQGDRIEQRCCKAMPTTTTSGESAMPGDTLEEHLLHSAWGPGMPLNILQCTGEPPLARDDWPQTSVVPTLRNPHKRMAHNPVGANTKSTPRLEAP